MSQGFSKQTSKEQPQIQKESSSLMSQSNQDILQQFIDGIKGTKLRQTDSIGISGSSLANELTSSDVITWHSTKAASTIIPERGIPITDIQLSIEPDASITPSSHSNKSSFKNDLPLQTPSFVDTESSSSDQLFQNTEESKKDSFQNGESEDNAPVMYPTEQETKNRKSEIAHSEDGASSLFDISAGKEESMIQGDIGNEEMFDGEGKGQLTTDCKVPSLCCYCCYCCCSCCCSCSSSLYSCCHCCCSFLISRSFSIIHYDVAVYPISQKNSPISSHSVFRSLPQRNVKRRRVSRQIPATTGYKRYDNLHQALL